jgi:hypothetical protein
MTQTREDKIKQDVTDLHGLGYAQELFRSMGGFSNFAISFSIISILTGAVILYDYGLAWAGNPANPINRVRSAPMDALDPLFGVEGIDWYSLQQGRSSAHFTQAAREARLRPLPAGTALADTAALIAELDLVISVCTSIAHLSGALGRPTWTMLAFAADWRWLRDRADSPWYPTMRLFRQPAPRDWSAVAQSVAVELRALVAAERELLAYLTKNKDWCTVPDVAFQNITESSGKSSKVANQACSVAEKMKKAQQQQAAGALNAPQQKLPAGPL